MPPPRSPRQAEAAARWWASPVAATLLAAAQGAWSAAAPATPGGQVRLCFRPVADWPLLAPTAPFGTCHALHREDGGWSGPWRSGETAWPVAAQGVARIEFCFVLEQADDPPALLAEAARVLCPEGRLLVLGLNPFGTARWRWARHGVRALPASRVAGWLDEAGLTRLDERRLGPRWRLPTVGTLRPAQGGAGRVAWALLATRRDPTPTPLRLGRPAWRPGHGATLA
jgi:SAM-dependent methyltransferase